MMWHKCCLFPDLNAACDILHLRDCSTCSNTCPLPTFSILSTLQMIMINLCLKTLIFIRTMLVQYWWRYLIKNIVILIILLLRPRISIYHQFTSVTMIHPKTTQSPNGVSPPALDTIKPTSHTLFGLCQNAQGSLSGLLRTVFSLEDARKITDFKSLSKLLLKALVKAH